MIYFLIVSIFFQQTLSFTLQNQKATGCSISIVGLNPEPIVVTSTLKTFIYPEPGQTTISLNTGDKITISCPGGNIIHPQINDTTVEATCVSGNNFQTGTTTFNFNNITCSRSPFHTARYTGKSCEKNGKEAEIGFILNQNDFARQTLICFDDSNLNPLYSHYNLTRSIGAHESGVSRPSFIKDDFYGTLDVNSLYTRTPQRTTINTLLGLPVGSTKYIQDSGDNYLARGHLTAKADYVYGPQQQATFHYVNAAPQWQSFNGVNWNYIEMGVRDYADLHGLDLLVYTGIYGVATLPHEATGEDVGLYLHVDGSKRGLAVPELYWKVVYNPATTEGVVLLGVNNPYQKDVSKSVICKDIADKINWINWDRKNVSVGYSYACAVDDFRKKVDYLPKFEVGGVLGIS